MEITHHPGADTLELRLTGRLDATWADHVSDTIETVIRAGSHRIVLNFAGVNYISSLGIAVLMKHYKRLQSINGSLRICEPTASILKVLSAARLTGFLLAERTPSPAVPVAGPAQSIVLGSAIYQAYPQRVETPLMCTAVGDPGRLAADGFAKRDASLLAFPAGSFGLGIGAFGEDFDDCRERFGEFLAAGGCAITLPTNDLHALPDYLVEEGVLVPRVETLYALIGAGDFPLMVRFDASPDGPGKVALSDLLESAFELTKSELLAFVVLAEAAGLVGATLRRSPAAGPVSLDLPSVRDWLTFTTERAIDRSMALLVGVVARNPPPEAAAFLRPLKNSLNNANSASSANGLHAHVHAAVFPYRPVQRGELSLRQSISDLVAGSSPSTVMHLMTDTRPYEGVGETDLVRGACWLGALQTISRA